MSNLSEMSDVQLRALISSAKTRRDDARLKLVEVTAELNQLIEEDLARTARYRVEHDEAEQALADREAEADRAADQRMESRRDEARGY